MFGFGSYLDDDGTWRNDDGSVLTIDFTATGSAAAANTATTQVHAGAPPGCPPNADGWQSQQNAFCADAYGWPLRPDGSVMTRDDIEAAARNRFIKDNWPYAAGALLFLLWFTGGKK